MRLLLLIHLSASLWGKHIIHYQPLDRQIKEGLYHLGHSHRFGVTFNGYNLAEWHERKNQVDMQRSTAAVLKGMIDEPVKTLLGVTHDPKWRERVVTIRNKIQKYEFWDAIHTQTGPIPYDEITHYTWTSYYHHVIGFCETQEDNQLCQDILNKSPKAIGALKSFHAVASQMEWSQPEIESHMAYLKSVTPKNSLRKKLQRSVQLLDTHIRCLEDQRAVLGCHQQSVLQAVDDLTYKVQHLDHKGKIEHAIVNHIVAERNYLEEMIRENKTQGPATFILNMAEKKYQTRRDKTKKLTYEMLMAQCAIPDFKNRRCQHDIYNSVNFSGENFKTVDSAFKAAMKRIQEEEQDAADELNTTYETIETVQQYSLDDILATSPRQMEYYNILGIIQSTREASCLAFAVNPLTETKKTVLECAKKLKERNIPLSGKQLYGFYSEIKNRTIDLDYKNTTHFMTEHPEEKDPKKRYEVNKKTFLDLLANSELYRKNMIKTLIENASGNPDLDRACDLMRAPKEDLDKASFQELLACVQNMDRASVYQYDHIATKKQNGVYKDLQEVANSTHMRRLIKQTELFKEYAQSRNIKPDQSDDMISCLWQGHHFLPERDKPVRVKSLAQKVKEYKGTTYPKYGPFKKWRHRMFNRYFRYERPYEQYADQLVMMRKGPANLGPYWNQFADKIHFQKQVDYFADKRASMRWDAALTLGAFGAVTATADNWAIARQGDFYEAAGNFPIQTRILDGPAPILPIGWGGPFYGF